LRKGNIHGHCGCVENAEEDRMSTEDRESRISRVLGAAVISRWGDLPHNIQQELFEEAVMLGHRDERDESLREELARFLHERRKQAPPGNQPE
jgi:hypothetical protein